MTIVSRELGIPPTSLNKRLPGSWMAASSRENHAELARHSRKQHASAPRRTYYDVVVVGAGAAGMAAAKRASEQGASTLLLDRGTKAGGILLQCIHNGFGLHRFKEELTGPEYALREAAALGGNGPEFVAGATVLGIQLLGDAAGESGNTADHGNNHREGSSTHPQDTQPSGFLVQAACPGGMRSIETKSVVLATGSRERGLGTLNLPGSRPSGVYSAGSAQALINLQGCLPGKHAVVLGSGDIGLIMARRMTVEGMQVEGVYEIADRPSGLRRNIVQCLEDFDIPLHLSKTVTKLEGANRLEAVWVSEVDPATWQPIPGTEVRIPCDTLVLSIGLTPENELAKALGIEFDPITGGARVDDRMTTSIPGIYACGNALHIHDLADYASTEGDSAGSSAAQWALGESTESETLPVTSGGGVRYVVPQSIHTACGNATLSFRVSGAMRRPLFEIRGITKQGESRVISKTKSAVAVPAEMVRMSLNSQELGQFERIEVHAINRGEK